MERAGITDPADVHYVQTKTPLLTIHTIRDAKRRGKTVWTEHTHESMDLSNGMHRARHRRRARRDRDADRRPTSCTTASLFSSVASCSSGVELDQAQVVVVGNARGVGGRYRIGHAVMQDALDADGIWAAIRDAGLDLPERPHRSDLDGRLVNVFLKCEASPDGQVARPAQRDARRLRRALAPPDQGCVGGVAASVTGDPAVFVSVSAAHQGPDGGGPVAAIVDLGAGEPTGYRWPVQSHFGGSAVTDPRRPGASHQSARATGGVRPSVGEVAGAGEVHRDAGRLGGRDDLVVADRAAGRDDGADAGVEQDLQPVGEREERVGGRDRAPRPARRPRAHREVAGVDPVDLAHADADGGAVVGEQDRVGLHRADRPPGEGEVGQRRLVGGSPATSRQRPGRRRRSASPSSRDGVDAVDASARAGRR